MALRRRCFSKNAVCVGFDSPLQIKESDSDIRPLKPGQVRVKISAAAINFSDILQCKGLYQERIEPPFVPGSECSGTIVEVAYNNDATRHALNVGDRVISFGNGGAFGTHLITDSRSCLVMKKDTHKFDLEDAAALMVSYGTAYMALRTRGNIQKDDLVLVTAAAGGVGLAACELASSMVRLSRLGSMQDTVKHVFVADIGGKGYCSCWL